MKQLQKSEKNRGVRRGAGILLPLLVYIVALAGLAYELVAGTMATYLVGQSVTQFSLATGWFLASMGLGSYLSRNLRSRLLPAFVRVQILLALSGGFSATIMFLAFAWTESIYPIFLLTALVVGSAVGYEIPILLRLAGRLQAWSMAVSSILTWDYLGALGAGVAFPLLFLPEMGLVRSSLLFGGLNLVAGWLVWLRFRGRRRVQFGAALTVATLTLLAGFAGAERITGWIEDLLYQDPVVLARTTPYQRIILTRWQDDTRLYLDGELQFSTRDEARYHESLVHIPILSLGRVPERVLILGGGDGLAARELLKYEGVRSITLVDLDPEMVHLFSRHPELRKINLDALTSKRVRTVAADALRFVKERSPTEPRFDLILIDLPDPNNHSLGKLYTDTFYYFVLRALKPDGIVALQATSPVFSPDVFYGIRRTLIEGFRLAKRTGAVLPYHTYIPSFGDWGFLLAGNHPTPPERFPPLAVPTAFLNNALVRSLFIFPSDFRPSEERFVNRLNEQRLVHVYEQSWKGWYD